MQRSLKLLLVFLSVVFFGLKTVSSIIALFVIGIICDLEEDFFRAFKSYIIGGHITSSSKNIRARISLLAFFFPKPLFGLFLNLFEALRITKGIICRLGLLNFFRVFDPSVFYGNSLGLYFCHSNMNKVIASLDLVVYLPNIGSRL